MSSADTAVLAPVDETDAAEEQPDARAVRKAARKAARKARRRDLVRKADRAAWRAFWFLIIPPLVPGVAAAWYFHEHDLTRMVIALGAVLGVFLLMGPFVLWWSIRAISRGTRFLPLPILTGFIAGFQTVGLALAVFGGGVGYTVLTGSPVPGMEHYPEVQKAWMDVDWAGTLLNQPYNGQETPDLSALLDKIPR